jgi:chromosome segregation ATPase
MRMRLRRLLFLPVALATIATAADAWAADTKEKESREREALRRAQQNAAKLQSEKKELSTKLDEADKEIAKQKSEAESSKLRAEELNVGLAGAVRENRNLKSRLKATEKSLAEIQALERDEREDLGRWKTIAGNLRVLLAGQNNELKACVGKNADLYRVARRLLDGYPEDGSWANLLPDAPGNGFRSVEMEKVLQEYDDKIRQLAVKKAPE